MSRFNLQLLLFQSFMQRSSYHCSNFTSCRLHVYLHNHCHLGNHHCTHGCNSLMCCLGNKIVNTVSIFHLVILHTKYHFKTQCLCTHPHTHTHTHTHTVEAVNNKNGINSPAFWVHTNCYHLKTHTHTPHDQHIAMLCVLTTAQKKEMGNGFPGMQDEATKYTRYGLLAPYHYLHLP